MDCANKISLILDIEEILIDYMQDDLGKGFNEAEKIVKESETFNKLQEMGSGYVDKGWEFVLNKFIDELRIKGYIS